MAQFAFETTELPDKETMEYLGRATGGQEPEYYLIQAFNDESFNHILNEKIAEGWRICPVQPQYAGKKWQDNLLYIMLLLER